MKMDRVFVLMLVVMLPMTGCFEDTVGDAEGSEGDEGATTVINNYYNNSTEYNHPPVISASVLGTPEYTDTNCITDGVQFQAQHAMMDWDGNIVQAGWDVNLDGSIDHYVTNTQDNIIVQIPLTSMTTKNDISGLGIFIDNNSSGNVENGDDLIAVISNKSNYLSIDKINKEFI